MSIHNTRFPKQFISGITATKMGYQEIDPIDVEEKKQAYKDDPFYVDKMYTDLLKDKNLFWEDNRLAIPNNEEIRDKILRSCHDSKFAGHIGRDKTYEMVSRQFWWPQLKESVAQHVKTCDSCQRVRQDNQKPKGLYKPLPIPEKPWSTVTMDLIVALPPTRDGNTAIAVFVDKLTKMIHIVPTTVENDAPELARLFLQNVFRYHGMPERFIHDRDTRFTSQFWTEFFGICNVSQGLSTAFHPQTDGQTEVVNKSIEDYLRHFGAENQDDWDQLLVFAEFTYNNSVHSSTGYSPFRLNYAYDAALPTSFSVFQAANAKAKPKRGGKCPGAEEFFVRIQDALKNAKGNLQNAQQRQKDSADTRRRHVAFSVGDMVMVATKNLHIKKGSTKKLLARFIGPFRITKVVNSVAMKVDLPKGLRMHDVFHVSLLNKYDQGKQSKMPPMPECIDGELEFEIEKIMLHDLLTVGRTKQLWYLIRWKGFSSEHDTWEPTSNLTTAGCQKLLTKYKKEHKLI